MTTNSHLTIGVCSLAVALIVVTTGPAHGQANQQTVAISAQTVRDAPARSQDAIGVGRPAFRVDGLRGPTRDMFTPTPQSTFVVEGGAVGQMLQDDHALYVVYGDVIVKIDKATMRIVGHTRLASIGEGTVEMPSKTVSPRRAGIRRPGSNAATAAPSPKPTISGGGRKA